jgi:hypothetical protein
LWRWGHESLQRPLDAYLHALREYSCGTSGSFLPACMPACMPAFVSSDMPSSVNHDDHERIGHSHPGEDIRLRLAGGVVKHTVCGGASMLSDDPWAVQDDFEEALGMHEGLDEEGDDAARADGKHAKAKEKGFKKKKGMGNVSSQRVSALKRR